MIFIQSSIMSNDSEIAPWHLCGVRLADDDVRSWGHPSLHASHKIPRAACHLGITKCTTRKQKMNLFPTPIQDTLTRSCVDKNMHVRRIS